MGEITVTATLITMFAILADCRRADLI